jgi:hypothetical protein
MTLSEYRASILRLIEAENIAEALEAEGYSEQIATMTANSKGFTASRSLVSSAMDSRKASE